MGRVRKTAEALPTPVLINAGDGGKLTGSEICRVRQEEPGLLRGDPWCRLGVLGTITGMVQSKRKRVFAFVLSVTSVTASPAPLGNSIGNKWTLDWVSDVYGNALGGRGRNF
jgi:hypothetical protein